MAGNLVHELAGGGIRMPIPLPEVKPKYIKRRDEDYVYPFSEFLWQRGDMVPCGPPGEKQITSPVPAESPVPSEPPVMETPASPVEPEPPKIEAPPKSRSEMRAEEKAAVKALREKFDRSRPPTKRKVRKLRPVAKRYPPKAQTVVAEPAPEEKANEVLANS